MLAASRRPLRFLLALSLCSVLLPLSPSLDAQRVTQAPASLTSLDSYIQQAVRDWGIAGLAIAIVQNDSVVYERGFGVREVGKPEPVDAHTIFAIGSNEQTARLCGIPIDRTTIGQPTSAPC